MRRISSEYHRGVLDQDFSRVMRDTGRFSGRGDGPRIGFASFGSGEWHLAIELLLAHALQLRGAQPSLLLCDLPALPVCDERTAFSRHRDRCDGCIAAKRSLLDAAGLSWHGVSAFVEPSAVARARQRVAAIEAGGLESHVERGWPVGQWLHVSGCHYLRCDERGFEPHKVEARRRWLATAIVIVEAVERWLDTTQPQIVIAESGAHLMWRIAFELARARGITVVCREMGKGGWDRHVYALNADAMSPDLDAIWADARHRPLSKTEEAAVDALVANLPADTFVANASRPGHLDIAPDQRVAVAFTNVTWDLATAGRDVAFNGVLDWLRNTIRAFEPGAAAHLVVRAHPAEASFSTGERILDQIEREWPGGPRNVTVVAPEHHIDAKTLCETADVVLAYNTTAGLEAAMYGRPVIVCGRPHYRNRGFTIDVADRTEYAQMLHAWSGGAALRPPANATDLARRYFHLFFARYHVPMGWTTSPLEPPFRLIVESIDELLPGRNAALDVVCDGILAQRQVVLPRHAGLACAP